MGIGVSVFLMAVGAILAFAVNVPGRRDRPRHDGGDPHHPRPRRPSGQPGLLGRLDPAAAAARYDDDADLVIRRRGPRVVEVDLGEPDRVVDIVEDRPVVEHRRVTTRRTTYDDF